MLNFFVGSPGLTTKEIQDLKLCKKELGLSSMRVFVL